MSRLPSAVAKIGAGVKSGPAGQDAEKALPPLRRAGALYLLFLLVLAAGFYVLMLASLGAAGWAFYELIVWTPKFLAHVRGAGAVKLLLFAYVVVGVFAWSIVKGLFAKAGGDPFGIKLNRLEQTEVFRVTDRVALKVGARPIEQIFLTPEDEVGVWEEAALFLPPGWGKRKLVLGMAALNYLTIDGLAAVLAHEYGHFSHKDTFFSRYIYRVSAAHSAVLGELAGQKIQLLNPFFWVLQGYVVMYHLAAASFSRRREFFADRFAVEAFGAKRFAQGLIAAHVEGAFFSQVGLRQVVQAAERGQAFENLYRFVSVARKRFDQQDSGAMWEVAGEILSRKTKAFDSHPSLLERLEAQGISAEAVEIAVPPRVAALSGKEGEDAVLREGPACAAELLFPGGKLGDIQGKLSEMAAAKYHYLIRMRRAMERMGE